MLSKFFKFVLSIVPAILVVLFVGVNSINVAAQEATPGGSNNHQFPSCESQTEPGDTAHYTDGLHWIVGGGLFEGIDDVYSLGEGDYLQCFCPPAGQHVPGNEGIQTNWESAHTVNKPSDRSGFFLVWGPDFGLNQSWFWASGADKPTPETPNIDCNPRTPESSPSPTPESTPSASPSAGSGGNNSSSSSSGQVAGATTSAPQVLAATGSADVYEMLMAGFGMIGAGTWLLRGKKQKAKSKKS